MDLRKVSWGIPQYISQTDTDPNSPDPAYDDLWAFTDPHARAVYAGLGLLQALEQDIRFAVMRGGTWGPEELAYKIQIRKLLRDGVITDKGTYWYLSPHPTVYRVLRAGRLQVAQWVYPFTPADEITFQCHMERDEERYDPGPALISRFIPAEKAVLCGEMSGAMRGSNRMA